MFLALFASRSLKCFFVGYPLGVKGYKLWCPSLSKCILSRNVIFNELLFYKDSVSDSTLNNDKDTEFEVEVGATSHNHTNGIGFEVEVPAAPQYLDTNPETENGISDDDGSTEDLTSPHGSSPELTNYQLARDRTKNCQSDSFSMYISFPFFIFYI